jgi:hypothetical protein
MAMVYSKFFRHKIPPHTPYKPSKLSRWKETLDITQPPLENSWRQAHTPQVLPKHRSLMLNITNRELWIGARVGHAAAVSQECSLCRDGDESIEHTFSQCHFAQKLCETTKEVIALTLKTNAQVGPTESIFGPQHQMTADDKRFWAVIRGHLLWTLWSARSISRGLSTANRPAIPDERLDDIIRLSYFLIA